MHGPFFHKKFYQYVLSLLGNAGFTVCVYESILYDTQTNWGCSQLHSNILHNLKFPLTLSCVAARILGHYFVV